VEPSNHDQGNSQQDLAEIILEEAVKSMFAAACDDSNDEFELTDS
jgi:hypothetical protein